MTTDPIDRQNVRPRFWETYRLEDLPRNEWEALCDGCGKCCLLKLEDEDTGQVAYTSISCRLLDPDTCRCGNYALRKQLVAGCVIVTPETLETIVDWMPRSCAYRLLAEGETLPDWHPLISGTTDSVHKAGVSFAGTMTPEYEVEEDDLEDYIVEGML